MWYVEKITTIYELQMNGMYREFSQLNNPIPYIIRNVV